jgi:isocitrate lyase
MFELASQFRDRGMMGYVDLQGRELAAEVHGYTATRHQHEVGTGYFEQVAKAIDSNSETTALAGSTEQAQF